LGLKSPGNDGKVINPVVLHVVTLLDTVRDTDIVAAE